MNNHKWAEFRLIDFFQLEKGNQNNMATLTDGDLPLVSARKCDNGYKQFVAPNKKRIFDGNIITLNNDGDGGAGIAYYQPHRMALDSHVTALIPKMELNKFHLLFVAMCITKQRDRFGHGYSLNASRLCSFKYMLPITTDGRPDWAFMENFMRQKEQQILKPTIDKLCKQLIFNQIGGGRHNLLNHKWKEFSIGDLFEAKRPSNRREDDYPDGKAMFVASGGINNGVTKFCQPKESEHLDKGNCLTVSPVDGSCHYQPVDFLGRGGAGSSIIILYAKTFSLDRFNGLFIAKAISQTAASKYSYGHMASLDRIKRDKILLPIDAKEQPDFAFMSSFMREVEKNILGTTIKYFIDKRTESSIQ